MQRRRGPKPLLDCHGNRRRELPGYQIYQYSAASDQYEMVADVEGGSTSYTVSGLTGATEYKFKIRAYEKNNDNVLAGSFRMFTAM